jgi:hypothetical protein
MSEDDLLYVDVEAIVSDEGTIVVFSGVDVDSGREVRFGVDHRAAQVLADALLADDRAGDAYVEAWQLL